MFIAGAFSYRTPTECNVFGGTGYKHATPAESGKTYDSCGVRKNMRLLRSLEKHVTPVESGSVRLRRLM